MYKRILVPVDGSVTAIRGLDEAIKLTKALDAKLKIVHIVDDSALALNPETGNWNGIMAPAGTPRDIVMRLHDEIRRRVLKSEVRQQLIRDGYEISGMGPEEYREYIRAELVKWAQVARTANIALQ